MQGRPAPLAEVVQRRNPGCHGRVPSQRPQRLSCCVPLASSALPPWVPPAAARPGARSRGQLPGPALRQRRHPGGQGVPQQPGGDAAGCTGGQARLAAATGAPRQRSPCRAAGFQQLQHLNLPKAQRCPGAQVVSAAELEQLGIRAVLDLRQPPVHCKADSANLQQALKSVPARPAGPAWGGLGRPAVGAGRRQGRRSHPAAPLMSTGIPRSHHCPPPMRRAGAACWAAWGGWQDAWAASAMRAGGWRPATVATLLPCPATAAPRRAARLTESPPGCTTVRLPALPGCPLPLLAGCLACLPLPRLPPAAATWPPAGLPTVFVGLPACLQPHLPPCLPAPQWTCCPPLCRCAYCGSCRGASRRGCCGRRRGGATPSQSSPVGIAAAASPQTLRACARGRCRWPAAWDGCAHPDAALLSCAPPPGAAAWQARWWTQK